MKRNPSSLSRNKQRKPNKRILIVCEGEVTEPCYFRALKDELRSNTMEIKIVPSSQTKGSSPKNLLEYAKEEYKRALNIRNKYDLIYCVFDKDNHSTFDKTVRDIKEQGGEFQSAISIPSFEYWLLLHYVYTDRPFSCSSEVENELAKYLGKYSKTYSKNKQDAEKLFRETVSYRTQAIENAKKVEKSGVTAPKTTVHKLVEYLMSENK